MHNKSLTLRLTKTAVIAAMYAALTLLFAPISYGLVQFRISEALTILPLFFIEAIPGLAIGCAIANILNGWLDVGLGSAATLIAATMTYLIGRLFRKPLYGEFSYKTVLIFILAALPPILINALVVPVILLTYAVAETYLAGFISVLIGQAVIIYPLGSALFFPLRRRTGLLQFGINAKNRSH